MSKHISVEITPITVSGITEDHGMWGSNHLELSPDGTSGHYVYWEVTATDGRYTHHHKVSTPEFQSRVKNGDW